MIRGGYKGVHLSKVGYYCTGCRSRWGSVGGGGKERAWVEQEAGRTGRGGGEEEEEEGGKQDSPLSPPTDDLATSR